LPFFTSTMRFPTGRFAVGIVDLGVGGINAPLEDGLNSNLRFVFLLGQDLNALHHCLEFGVEASAHFAFQKTTM
jgi:hypothetical protein